MATFNVNKASGSAFSVPYPARGVYVWEKTVDFTETANQLAQNAIMALFKIPADVLVCQFLMEVLTADTDITTVELGTYTENTSTLAITEVDLDGFGVNSTLAATGYVAMDVDAVYNPAGTAGRGFLSTADTYLCVKNTDAQTLDEAIVRFVAWGVDLRPITPAAGE